MPVRRFLIAIFLLAWAGVALAAPPPARKVTSVEGITEYRLTNGLRVLLFPDPSASSITINLTYMVGSRYEGYGETGMAHLLEHMMFKGSTNHPHIPAELTQHGARPNGTTSFDRTQYYETCQASEANLRWALALEADRMVNSFIAKKDLDSEMTVVRNEYESGENDPRSILMERVMETAWIWHNYAHPTIGARSDIEKVPIERLQAFYHKYYQPDNAILVVAGKIDEAHTLALVQHYFGDIPRPDRKDRHKIFPTYTEEPTQDGERMITLRRVGEEKVVVSLYHCAPGAHPDFAPLDVLGTILGDTPSGRLYKALVETKKAVSVSGGAEQLREPGCLMFEADLPKEGNLQDVSDILTSTVEKFAATPPTKEEVERARTSLLKELEMTLNSSQSLALQLSEWASFGDWRLFFLYRDRLKAVTPEDVERVAQFYLKPSNRTLGWFIPTPEPDRVAVPWLDDPAAAVKNYKGQPPVAQGEAFDPSPANIDARTRRLELPGGMKLALLTKKTRGEKVHLSLMFRFGSLKALEDRSTAGDFCGSMLMRGTLQHTREQLADEFDRLQSSVSVNGGSDYAAASIETTRAKLVPTLQLVAEVLQKPSFNKDEFERLQQAEIASIQEESTDPENMVSVALNRHMDPYPKTDPRYQETPEESIAEVRQLTLEQVKKFYQDFYGGSVAECAVVGDFDGPEIEAQLGQLFSGWKSPQPYERLVTPYFEVAPLEQTIPAKDKANAVVEASENLKLKDDDPDYPGLVLGNYMLGGGFLDSRLANRIRQKEGLSYGVGSSLSAGSLDAVGSFGFNAICAPQNADRVIVAFREELARVLKDGFSAEELSKARSGYLQRREAGRASDAGLAGIWTRYLYLGRTLAWDADWESRIKALTPEQIHAALQRHLDPSKLTIMKAGDFK